MSDDSSRAALAAALAAAAIILLAGAAAVTATIQATSPCARTGGVPSAAARQSIPSRLLPVFAAAERAYGVPWNVLAAVNRVETDFGRNLGPSSAGAIGWMQFLPATWARYGIDADGDGRADHDPADAIFTTAAYLRVPGAPTDLRGALLAYNHSASYVEQVLTWARRFAALPTRASAASCATGVAATGRMVRIAPGANLPGRPLAAETLAFLARVAALYGRPLVVTTGTNHGRYTVDGGVSDHADGHAADLGMTANGGRDDSPVGDRITAACLIAAGEAPDRAVADASRGGLYTLEHDALRVQCIWKTNQGGNHHNHVHVGARGIQAVRAAPCVAAIVAADRRRFATRSTLRLAATSIDAHDARRPEHAALDGSRSACRDRDRLSTRRHPPQPTVR